MAQIFETARRAPWRLGGLALALWLGACSVGFDVPLPSDRPTAWQDDLAGFWKVEFETEEGAKGVTVAELRKLEDGAFQLNLLAEGLTSVTLRFASHGGRDYAVYDLGSYLEFKPLAPEPDLFQFTSGKGTYGVVLLRREGDQVIAYEMLRAAVERDLASGPLAGVAQEGCVAPRPAPEPGASPDGKPETGPAFTCRIRIGDEAALGAYLDARGEVIFDLEKPTRFTRLF